MRVTAIVHEWFASYAGSERVVEQFLLLYPDARLHALVDLLNADQRGFLGHREVATSFIQRIPFLKSRFRIALPLMPLAVEQIDLRGFDLILSSNHAVAKGVIRGLGQLHISYIHTPIRYAWDLQHQYLEEAGLNRGIKGWLTRAMLHRIRLWDQAAANRVDVMVANSRYIAQRIWACYRREAVVIHPPVDVDSFPLCREKDDFYLAASRLVPYKRMAVIAEAFARMPNRKLVIIGDGPEMAKVRQFAGPNTIVMGYQSNEVLRDHMQRAKGFVFAAEEDFGITPVEAMACGTPVIAYGKGGILDSVVDGQTGLFFPQQTPEAVVEAIERFEQMTFDPVLIRERAEQFRPERFREKFSALVDAEWKRFRQAYDAGEIYRQG